MSFLSQDLLVRLHVRPRAAGRCRPSPADGVQEGKDENIATSVSGAKWKITLKQTKKRQPVIYKLRENNPFVQVIYIRKMIQIHLLKLGNMLYCKLNIQVMMFSGLVHYFLHFIG